MKIGPVILGVGVLGLAAVVYNSREPIPSAQEQAELQRQNVEAKARMDRDQAQANAKAADERAKAERERVAELKKNSWKAENLVWYYEQNEIKADSELKGVLVVNGKIETIAKDIMGTPYITLGKKIGRAHV